MDNVTTLPLEDFLDQVAARVPTPGGGGVTAATGALACAMARMVAAYSMGKKTSPGNRMRVGALGQRLQRADELLRALVTQDGIAYTKMTEAIKNAGENPKDKEKLAAAVMGAIAVPMEMAALVSEILAIMNEFKGMANRYLLSDLGVAAVLADATARAARYSIQVNLGQLEDEDTRAKVRREIDETVDHCSRHRASVESFVRGNLE